MERRGEGCTFLALTEPGKAADIARWLETFQPSRLDIAPGLAPKGIRARFDTTPGPWTSLLAEIPIAYLVLTPQGIASLFVEETRDTVRGLVARLRRTWPEIRSRETHIGQHNVRLTPRQLEILSLAVALGYYELPRRIDLRTLCKKMGISLGAGSELLRRGEALIMTSHVDSLTAHDWQEMEHMVDADWDDTTSLDHRLALARRRLGGIMTGR